MATGIRLPATLVLSAALSLPLSAEYIQQDIADVPIDRLVKNLEAEAEKNPADAQGWVHLARLHGMAYARKKNTVPVSRLKGGEAVFYGFAPLNVPFADELTKAPNPAADAAARGHLEMAIAYYRRALGLRPDDLTIQLGLAWCLQHAGERADAITRYRAVIEAAWKVEKDLKEARLGWHSITAEAAGYLMPLLTRDDLKEIQTLAARTEQMAGVRRPITPIAVPLRDGLSALDITDARARVRFDADGSGIQKQWTWITPDAAWLVWDPKQRGSITSALQWFGSVTFWLFWPSGYHALAALDDDRDGEIRGAELDGLALWRDANVNGVSDPGEVQPVSETRIVALSVRAELDPRHPDEILWSPRGVTFAGGSTRPTFDLVLSQR